MLSLAAEDLPSPFRTLTVENTSTLGLTQAIGMHCHVSEMVGRALPSFLPSFLPARERSSRQLAGRVLAASLVVHLTGDDRAS